MINEKMLWNKDHTASVRASKLRNIVIYPDRRDMIGGKVHTEVKGWYNDNDYFDFGWFDNQLQATVFVEALHAKIEE